ncbi:universal stress protein [Candidatus Poribacteria bacterium]|nr:universal stress protein [Candidatus Poribacteria bacterium]
MIKNIVVSLDGSNYSWSAARHAIQMARPYRASIHGVYAIDLKIIKGQLLDDLKVDSATAQSIYQDKGRILLEQLESECKAAGVAFHPVLTTGAVSNLICHTALQAQAELVAMGKKGVNAPWSEQLLGSIAESLVHQAKRPVLLAQEVYAPIEMVYVAYDGKLVSIRALRFAAELCARNRWKMCVISVHSSEERIAKLFREAVEMANIHGLKITTIGRSGDVVKQILSVTSEDRNALIVLGAYSSRLRRLILGNVPEQIIHTAPQPVLLYRPSPY